ncbi:hypothetical protein AgCh_006709 [Apium graveolens]
MTKLKNTRRYSYHFSKSVRLATLLKELMKLIQRAGYEQYIFKLAIAYEGYRFYLPAFMDFRGRIYRSGILHFHERDLARSLVIFAKEDVQRTSNIKDSFFCAASFLYGSFENNKAAVEWFDNNMIEALRVSSNDELTRLACDAKKPLQFLSCLVVFKEYLTTQVLQVITSHPITQDASASAYQLMSYFLLDKDLAKNTNLIQRPGDSNIQDIYEYLLEEVQVYINETKKYQNDSLILFVGSKLTRKARPANESCFANNFFIFPDRMILLRTLILDRGVSFPIGRKKWEEATETLLRGEGSEVWKEKRRELDEQWVDGPFYQSLRGLLSEWDKNKKRRQVPLLSPSMLEVHSSVVLCLAAHPLSSLPRGHESHSRWEAEKDCFSVDIRARSRVLSSRSWSTSQSSQAGKSKMRLRRLRTEEASPTEIDRTSFLEEFQPLLPLGRKEKNFTFDSYTIPEDDPELGQSRLLEVDNRVVVPAKTHLRIIVTPADVPHSWVVPSSGVKCDAVPGRLNQISISVQREGVYYGQ